MENNNKKSEDGQFDDKVRKIIGEYLKGPGFKDRKLTDTPTDDNQVVPRKYVNMNGSILSAPISSIIGQQYFASDLGYPVFKNSNYRWVNSVGSVVG